MGWIRHLFLNLLLNALALLVVDQLLPQMTVAGGAQTYLIAALILGVVNAVVKPLLKLIAFPLMMVTAGLFIFVINAVVLYSVTLIIPLLKLNGFVFQVEGLVTFFIAALLFSVVNYLEHWLVHDRK